MTMTEHSQTSETAPRHLWKDAVATDAIARGVPADWMRGTDVATRINGAYNAGEPVWMIVDELVFRHKRSTVEHRADGDMRTLRRAIRGE